MTYPPLLKKNSSRDKSGIIRCGPDNGGQSIESVVQGAGCALISGNIGVNSLLDSKRCTGHKDSGLIQRNQIGFWWYCEIQ